MCGIAGIYCPGGRAGVAPPPESMQRALQRMQRRGPDDSGVWDEDEGVQLGHRRLAVIDLSAAGHQPMETLDERFVIVFNGEIYNHLELRKQLNPIGGWRGSSDTETLLEAFRKWGPSCLKRLNGMFAFAIWDRADRRLFVARDRLGVKPLYYSWDGRRFAFASRPAALAELLEGQDLSIDPEALRVYLELGYIPAPLSLYRGIHKLKPAHYVWMDERGPCSVRYWDYRHIAPDQSLLRRSESDLVQELDDLVRDAVSARLLSDVPLGAFLSGGIDSALTVALMAAIGGRAPTAFTIGFEERSYDEAPAAARIARHLDVKHVCETLSVDSLLELLPLYLEQFDEPLADSSSFPTMAVARLARRHATVVLTGDGGDELFGGYHYYHLTERLASLAAWRPGVKRLLQQALARVPSHKAKLLAGALPKCDTPVGLFQYLRSFNKDFPSLLAPDVLSSTGTAESWLAQTAASFAMDLSPAEVGMRLDTAFMLADGYLQKVDVSTMAFSLEARSPLVDYRLVEWSMRLPLQYKIRGGQTKYLLKKVLCQYLPEEVVYQPKRGFGVPMARWLRGPLRQWALERVNDAGLMSRLPLDANRVRELLQLHLSGARDAHPLLWAVLMLLSFVDRQRESAAAVELRHAA